jgi:hypothetical protein
VEVEHHCKRCDRLTDRLALQPGQTDDELGYLVGLDLVDWSFTENTTDAVEVDAMRSRCSVSHIDAGRSPPLSNDRQGRRQVRIGVTEQSEANRVGPRMVRAIRSFMDRPGVPIVAGELYSESHEAVLSTREGFEPA